MKLALISITIAFAAIATAAPTLPAQNDMPQIPVNSSDVEAVEEHDAVRGLPSFHLRMTSLSAFH